MTQIKAGFSMSHLQCNENKDKKAFNVTHELYLNDVLVAQSNVNSFKINISFYYRFIIYCSYSLFHSYLDNKLKIIPITTLICIDKEPIIAARISFQLV